MDVVGGHFYLARVRPLDRTWLGSQRKPVLLGSGTNAENIAEFLQWADGALVGTSLKYDGVAHNPVDPVRVRRFMEVVRGVRESVASAAGVNR